MRSEPKAALPEIARDKQRIANAGRRCEPGARKCKRLGECSQLQLKTFIYCVEFLWVSVLLLLLLLIIIIIFFITRL